MEQDGSKKYNRGMDYFYELYASYIFKHAIELSKDDVLSINTEVFREGRRNPILKRGRFIVQERLSSFSTWPPPLSFQRRRSVS